MADLSDEALRTMTDTRELERRLLELAAGIKVTPDNECDELIATVVNAAMAYPFEEAAAALAAQRAEIEAMTVILNLCTEGTDWTYAQVPDELAAQREELERLRNGLCYFIGKAFADGFFSDEPALQEHVRLWVLERAEAMDDDLTIGQVVQAILRDDALSPLPAAPATEKEKP